MKKKTAKRIFWLLVMNFSILAASLVYNSLFEKGLVGSCVFLETFSLYCPGCGGSRSLNALLNFNILKSFIYYPAIPVTAALILYCDAAVLYSILKERYKIREIKYQLFLIIPAVIILNFIIRNVILFFGIDLLGNVIN